jgi:hypothetical protein
MTTAVHRPAAAWAAAHRALLVLLALAVVLATVAVTLLLRSAADSSSSRPTSPQPYVEQECVDPPVQMITFRPIC